MSKSRSELPFGGLLGIAPGQVEAYSSDYERLDPELVPDRHAFRNYHQGTYTGYKWQCVEFARRWLLVNQGLLLEDVPNACDLIHHTRIRDPKAESWRSLYSFANGSRRPPEPGALLIFADTPPFERTGHVAVFTEVGTDFVALAEQNYDFRPWPEGWDHSRKLVAKTGRDGSFWIESGRGTGEILGWILVTEDPSEALPRKESDPELLEVRPRRARKLGQHEKEWLNLANPDEAAYVEANQGLHEFTARIPDQYRYFAISESALQEMRLATDELHQLFLQATDYVLQKDSRLEAFGIPEVLWKRIHESWDRRRSESITGRFDFCLDQGKLKVYEYNSDSASCHFEAGKAQGAWFRHFGVELGRDPGAQLWNRLVEAWRGSQVDGRIHILIDEDPEERYHAAFMKTAMEAAGHTTRVVQGLGGLTRDAEGRVVDSFGERVAWVWKSWAWETALDQLREQEERDAERIARGERVGQIPRLMDVLFQSETTVFEPMWNLIPSNKAILPVLWSLFPGHRYLLESAHELTASLRSTGYVQKPIAGRRGRNITVVGEDSRVLEETSGRFSEQEVIYQSLAPLPYLQGRYVQLCTFVVEGRFAAAVARTETTPIITAESDLMPLRVISDRDFRGT